MGYQENSLSKYHVELGYDVYILCSDIIHENGSTKTLDDKEYINEDGCRVIRLKFKFNIKDKFFRYLNLKEKLEEINPDIIFCHGPEFMDADVVSDYVRKHSNVTLYVDNHSDFSNSSTNIISKYILGRIFRRKWAQELEPYTKKFYGVLPARVDFLIDEYKLPKDKCELLVMGADDEFVYKASNFKQIASIKKELNIKDNDFVIITGGKIDLFKTQTLLLMKAINDIDREDIKLLIFGSVVDELKEEFDELVNKSNGKIIYIGWLSSKQTYDYIAIADLAVYPGRHSVLWEQTVGQGVPMFVKHWEGTHHVDLGGNVEFLYNDSEQEIKDKILSILNNKDKYKKMKDVAKNKGMDTFSYKEIAKKP